MRGFTVLAPLLTALLLATALAAGLSHGQMLRADALASLDICADEEDAGAICLDCDLGAGLSDAGRDLVSRTAGAERGPAGGNLVAGPGCAVGGGARAPPDWV